MKDLEVGDRVGATLKNIIENSERLKLDNGNSYVLSKKALVDIYNIPKKIVELPSFLQGVTLLPGDTVSLRALSPNEMFVSLSSSGLPFWGVCRDVEDVIPFSDLPEFSETHDEIVKLGCKQIMITINRHGSVYNRVQDLNGVKTLWVGDSVDYSDDAIIEEWTYFKDMLQLVEQSIIPVYISSIIVDTLIRTYEKIMGQEFDLSIDTLEFELNFSQGGIESIVKVGETENSISILNSSNDKVILNEGWVSLLRDLSFLTKQPLYLKATIGGDMWSRSACLLCSTAYWENWLIMMNIQG